MGREVRDANIGGYLQFQGDWRVYQQRVLDHADEYLKDGKVHIVAPPGSGKTTLGIELLRRMGRPCLILSPSIVIRQQWLERVQTAFLQVDTEGVLSGDIRKPAAITAITYQALHAAMEKLRITEETGEGKQGICEAAYMNGYNWEVFFFYYLSKLAPELLVGLKSDPESRPKLANQTMKLTRRQLCCCTDVINPDQLDTRHEYWLSPIVLMEMPVYSTESFYLLLL